MELEMWRLVWRRGFQPSITTAGLRALRDALRDDDPRLVQGVTAVSASILGESDRTCLGACAVGYAGWQGNGLQHVSRVEKYFADLCYEADARIGEPAACRYFLNWFDDTPRDEVRRELLAEVDAELTRRQTAETAAVPVEAMYREVGGEG